MLQVTVLCDLVVDQDASAIFANDDLLPRFDVKLALRGYLVKTAAACIALDRNNCKAVSGISSYPFIGGKKPLLYNTLDLF